MHGPLRTALLRQETRRFENLFRQRRPAGARPNQAICRNDRMIPEGPRGGRERRAGEWAPEEVLSGRAMCGTTWKR